MRPNQLDIAIVGMASHFPDAPDLYDFWTNVVGRRDAISDVERMDGDEYWRKSDFFDPDPSAVDKTYGHKAGFAPPIRFDPVEFKMPPLMVESISTAQIFALYVARQAMEDARLAGEGARAFDRDRMGVILGGGGNGNTAFSLACRQQAPYLRRIMVNAGLSEVVADDVIDRVKGLYLEWNEDSFPGFLGNVACGRIASYFDLGGTSYMVDAACASSLAAVKAAIGELADGSCDSVLTGGVNLENSVFSFMCFSKTPALSRSNRSRPFDASSDGMMLGDGVGFLVLKRLADAQRDGDRVYAVIKSVQASSDGRAKSIFAPRHEGQVKAMRRAYEQAGVSPAQIQLVEAHGTGTASGDQTEIKSLRTVFESSGAAAGSVAIGSIKSQIGHTRCAAGAASMMKVALGLHHKVLPPTINVEQPSKDIAHGVSPFYVNTQTRPWFRPAEGMPRRAALSAFGFGGTNFHAILEEYGGEPAGAFRLNRRPEVIVLQAGSPAGLLDSGRALLAEWQSASEEAAQAALRRHQRTAGAATQVPPAAARLAFAADGVEDAARLLDVALKQLAERPGEEWEHPLGIYYKPSARPTAGRVVALFPGQGSQYVDMARDLAVDYPEVRRAVEALDAVARAQGAGALSPVIYPVPAFGEAEAERQSRELTRTSRAQPAIGAVSAGCFRLLQGMGLAPDFLAGHSYGELTALWAAGVFGDEDFLRVSLARGAAVEGADEAAGADRGAMLAVPLEQPRVEEMIAQFPGLVVANYNSPAQLVLGGPADVVRRAHEHLAAQQVRAQVLPVSAAFHTHFVQHACAPFEAALQGVALGEPAGRVYSTATAQPHGNEAHAIRTLLVRQLVSPVRFTQTIEAIHAQGGDLFIEIGPKGVLGKLVADILKGRPHAVVSINPSASGDGALQFKRALARLVAEGVPLRALDPQAAELPGPRERKSGLSYTVGGGFFMPEKARRRRQRALRTGDTQLVDAFAAERAGQAPAALAPLTDKLEETPAIPAKAPAEARPARTATAAGRGGPAPIVVQPSKTFDDPSRGRKQAAAQPIGVQTMNSGTETDILSALDAQVRAQQVLSQVHQQFQLNQRDYIQLLDALMTRQCSLLEKFQGSPQLSAVVSSLSQSFQLLDKNQELYHINHGHYFDNQQALIGEAPRAGRVSAAAVQHAPLQALTLHEPAVEAGPAARAQPARPVQPVEQPSPARTAAAAHTAPAALAPVHAPKASLPEGAATRAAAPAAVPAQPQPAPVQAPATQAAAMAPAQPAAPARELSAEDQALVRRFEAVTQEDLVRQIVAIVSDRTGYPADMINEEMDLEADLGIDSIKRLEIFGAMFDQLSANVSYFQDAEQHKDMETFDIDAFSNIRKMAIFFKDTIAELLDHLKSGRPLPSATAKDAKEEPAAKPPQQQPAHAAAGQLRETPPSEAPPLRNLGFVTSTRALGEEHDAKKSSADPREDASAPAQRLTSSDADQLKTAAGAHPAATSSGTEGLVRRLRPRLHALPPADQRELDVQAGSIWLLVDDGQGLGTALAQALVARQQRVVRLLGAGVQPVPVRGVQDQVLEGSDEASLQTVLDRITYSNGPVAGLVHLLPAAAPLRSLDEVWDTGDLERARLAYTLAKLLQPGFARMEAGRSWFFVVTRIDGRLGTSGRGLFPLATAGLTGLAKSLNIEWEGSFCRAVDIDPQLAAAPAAALLMEELADSRTDIGEVGRGAHGERVGIGHEPAPVDEREPVTGVDASSVFVVTGGARGITADCVVALARQVPARFALLGRTRIDAPAPAWAEGAQGPAALKAAAIRHLQRQGGQPTPVKVERLLDEVLHAAQVRRTLQQVQEAGGHAIYLACDITDAREVAAAVARAREELGPVTGLIHGAGNLADKRIEKKTGADFERVFLTKIRGLECLMSAVPAEQLRHVLLFSSVSGFFGNAGQTDYAMANESLNKFAWMFRARFPQALVRSINWGPWDTGMVNEVLRKAYAQRGLVVIPAEAGVRHFVDEFRAGASAGTPAQTLVGGDSYKVAPKVRRLPALTRVTRQIRPADNPFLEDHVVADRSVLPAAAAAGWMVQVCEDLLPGYRAERLEEFRVLKGLVFGPEAQRVVAELRPVEGAGDAGGERHVLAVTVLSENGSIPQHRYEARVHMTQAAARPGAPLPGGWTEPAADLFERQGIYGDMARGALLFHGPAFRGLQALWSVDDRGLHASCRLEPVPAQRQGQFAANSFNPYLGDVLLQLPLAWLMLRSDEAGLPSHIERWEQFAPPAFGQPFQLSMQVTSRTRAALVADVTACDVDGRVLARIVGLAFTVSERLRQTLAGDGKPDLAAA